MITIPQSYGLRGYTTDKKLNRDLTDAGWGVMKKEAKHVFVGLRWSDVIGPDGKPTGARESKLVVQQKER